MRKRKHSLSISRKLQVKVIEQNLESEQVLDGTAMSVMECLEGKLSPDLLDLLKEMLLGFCGDMQLEIADDLLDFAYGHVIHTTGCVSADTVLLTCYQWIAAEQGIELNYSFFNN